MSVNKVTLLGHLGADPELRFTQAQLPVCTLSLATNSRQRGSDGEWQEKTEWHRVVAFDKPAENVAQYLKKGSKVYVDGRLQTRKYTDKKTGQERYTTEVIAKRVEFLDRREEASATDTSAAAAPPAGLSEPVPLEEAEIAFEEVENA